MHAMHTDPEGSLAGVSGQAEGVKVTRSQHLLRSMCVNTKRSSTAVVLCSLSMISRTCTYKANETHVAPRLEYALAAHTETTAGHCLPSLPLPVLQACQTI